MALTIPSDLFSSLPNLHPVIVHLPLGLLPAAALFDLLLFAWARAAWADRASAWLHVLAALAAAGAVKAGQAAAAALGPLDPAARDLLHEHERLAIRALWALAAVALLRVVTAWRDRRTGVVPRGILRTLVLAGSLATVGLLAMVADHGGRLVYRHGVAVGAAPWGAHR